MCIYTVRNQKLKKNSQERCTTSPNVPICYIVFFKYLNIYENKIMMF